MACTVTFSCRRSCRFLVLRKRSNGGFIYYEVIPPYRFLSTTSSFFSQTSGRSRRRQRRAEAIKQHRHEHGAEQDEDTRTVKDILFPGTDYGEVPNQSKIKWPNSFSQWKRVVFEACAAYKSTWEGFFTNRGFLVEDKTTIDEQTSENVREKVRGLGKDVAKNAKQNAQFLRMQAENLRTEVRDQTGIQIQSKEDLKRFAGDMMKLFSDCVKEFMAGYRKGRDDEAEKMLTQYFQDLGDDQQTQETETDQQTQETETQKPKRRKRKRRVLS